MAEVPVDLYRSCRSKPWGTSANQRETNFSKAEGAGAIRPEYDGFWKGEYFRAADVTTFDKEQATWVRGVSDRDGSNKPFVSAKEGVSVSKTAGGFGYQGWFYFLLPEGTDLPASLDVKATPTRKDPGHHSIRCLNQMRQDAYEGALDNLTRAALAKAVEAGKKSFIHS